MNTTDILPAVEPGILAGGISVWFAEGTSISHLVSGCQDAARYGSQDGRRHGLNHLPDGRGLA